MCGIIGYTGKKSAAQILLDGLTSLEYRGYDSAGIAVIDPSGKLVIDKKSGKLDRLRQSISESLPNGTLGIGHTRWATHGEPNEANAHPHVDCTGQIVVVHNGIVENYLDLKANLIQQGHTFKSETDSEVIAHLIESLVKTGMNLEEAARRTATRLMGSHAVVVIDSNAPNILVAFRVGHAGGLFIGNCDGETFVASDLPAILPHTQTVTSLAAGEVALISPGDASYSDFDGVPVTKTPEVVPYDTVSVARGGYKHFMLKEIAEQPQAIVATLRGRVSFKPWSVALENVPFSKTEIMNINRVIFIGMGTSLHACLIASRMMEELSGIPSSAENASEFRYRDPIIDSRTLVVSVGQSGETADTLSGMEEASKKGAHTITVCNAEGSQATRMADGIIYLKAGPEIGVASTKTFICSLEALYILSLYIGSTRGHLSDNELGSRITDLTRIPDLLGGLIHNQEPYSYLSELYHNKSHFLYLGRGITYPVALEGALKLKEISYIHAEGSPAGEIKHGPIALIDERMPVVAIAPQDNLQDKMANNISEVKTRGGTVIAVATEGDTYIPSLVDHTLYIPKTSLLLTPIVASVPLQLLAYHLAVRLGRDVDQPRNLAKTVTVE